MEKRIILYIAFWGSMIMSCVTEHSFMKVLWLLGAIFFAFLYLVFKEDNA